MPPPAPPSPSRAELRKLVMNYLCHYCFVDTAKAFSKEVPLHGWYEGEEDGKGPESVSLTEEQITGLEVRSAVREHILTGQIAQAQELVTTYFPDVLSDLPPAPLPPPQPYIIPQPPPVIPTTPVRPEYPSSLIPANMSMTLSIQDWIEQIRTISLPYPERIPTPSPAEPVSTTKDSVALVEIGQKLYARARTLNPPNNDVFREEVLNISPLITWSPPEYKAPENVRHHLEWSRRKGVATQLNSAILASQGFPPNAPISSLVRQLTFVYQMLHELRVRPPTNGYPSGVDLLEAEDGDDLEWAAEAIPEFKLELYLAQERMGKGDDEDEDMDAEGEEEGEEIEG